MFGPDTTASIFNKDRHDITRTVLKVTLVTVITICLGFQGTVGIFMYMYCTQKKISYRYLISKKIINIHEHEILKLKMLLLDKNKINLTTY